MLFEKFWDYTARKELKIVQFVGLKIKEFEIDEIHTNVCVEIWEKVGKIEAAQ